MDTGLNRSAAGFVHDLYPALCRRFGWEPRSGSRLLAFGKAFSGLLGLIILSLALYMSRLDGPGIFEYNLLFGAVFGVPLAIPYLLSLFIKRTPSWAAVFSVALTSLPAMLGLVSEQVLGEEWSFQKQIFINTTIGVVSYVSTMPFWGRSPDTYKQQVVDFFDRMYRPVDFEREVGEANDLFQLKILGSFSVGIGAMVLLLLFLTNPWEGRLGIGFTGVFMVAVGLTFIRSARIGHPITD